ncbi:hypothetical protein LZ518_03015 [Sphingomonas sp. RB56-2]|uniref:Uncharacterized protein n=1 Tax=Sphingomonas brevis TaxID=2908206 RepID=A0ABT0S7L1_9SPHN|nr:hypothetical protein [Sphingomonas brevis]MCL6740107.1 hypothetical protein [Sphingomonas brevis]
MSEAEVKKKSRLRWVTLGEAIAIAALVVSGLGLWREYTKPDEKPLVVEKQASIPLRLGGHVADEGRVLEITPVEGSHALQSLAIAVGASKIELGGDGELGAKALEDALGKSAEEGDGMHRVRVRIDAKYVEAGADKSATGSYVISYNWDGGGLLGGRSLRLAGLSR